jgi:hypothetical protein
MKTIQATNGKIILYDSIRDLPIKRYNAFNRALIQDSGIGSDLNAISKHFAKLDTFLRGNKIQEALQERENLHVLFWSMLEGINYQSNAFLALCYSINDRKVGDIDNDIEQEECLRLLEETQVSQGDVEEALEDIRKKWIAS